MVNAQCKKARNFYCNKNIADVQQSNPKQWWSAVKKIVGLYTPKMPKTLIYNDCTYQGEDLANLFNNKFVAVGSSLPPLTCCPLPVDVYPPKFIVSVEETETALLSSKLHSAIGPDEISAWFPRENASVLCRPLCSIFNSSLRQGFVPSLWKSANVLPIPKSFPALNIDLDFRPISLAPILSKFLESFPYRWLLQSVSNQIDPVQFGSQRGSSASMALVHFLHKWYEACDDLGSSLWICLLNFSKAFDRVKCKWLFTQSSLIQLPTSCPTDSRGQTSIREVHSSWCSAGNKTRTITFFNYGQRSQFKQRPCQICQRLYNVGSSA